MLDLNTIHHGCCLQLMQDIPDGSVDMILCDLPYGTTQNSWDSTLPLDKLWKEYWRLLKPNGAVALTAQPPFDKVLGVSQLRFLKYEWIWAKSRATGHLNAKKQPMKAHENVLLFYQNQCTYNPQGTRRKALATIRKGGNNGSNYGLSDKDAIQEHENYPTSILAVPSVAVTSHPTQKPVALFEYLIRTYTNPGEVVLDNCAGSFTTAVAAENTGRRWICIEQEAKYCEVGRQRLAALQPTLFSCP